MCGVGCLCVMNRPTVLSVPHANPTGRPMTPNRDVVGLENGWMVAWLV